MVNTIKIYNYEIKESEGADKIYSKYCKIYDKAIYSEENKEAKNLLMDNKFISSRKFKEYAVEYMERAIEEHSETMLEDLRKFLRATENIMFCCSNSKGESYFALTKENEYLIDIEEKQILVGEEGKEGMLSILRMFAFLIKNKVTI